jgi:threonine dehydrogenase-like Zn-dependent dehydrogenase
MYYYHVCIAYDRPFTDDEMAQLRNRLGVAHSRQNPHPDPTAPAEARIAAGVTNIEASSVDNASVDSDTGGDVDVVLETMGGATVAAGVIASILREVTGEVDTAVVRVRRLPVGDPEA